MLCDLSHSAENTGLLALMLLHDSRRDARVRDGELVAFGRAGPFAGGEIEMSEGLALVDRALLEGPLGPYQLQLPSPLCALKPRRLPKPIGPRSRSYERLLGFHNTPVIALNHAVAIAMGVGLPKD